jgi:hypothetical protein
MELDLVKIWLSLVAIKDMTWTKGKKGWRVDVSPVGDGIVRWNEVAQGLKDCKYAGTISLHGEYEAEIRPPVRPAGQVTRRPARERVVSASS